ncbi:hypothetical protein CEP51_014247 [Fusarium floridanum]|uniref:NACHT domain-containing protein n=1 Tax=Fusarium floridanum TaxID=1325733 RepID=A0A428PWG5_9HYPO|nr:hypothetical protein CEP51_014247 [Fusarium floridanum]
MADSNIPQPKPTTKELAEEAQRIVRETSNKYLGFFSPDAQADICSFNDAEAVINHIKRLQTHSADASLGLPSSVDSFCRAIDHLSKSLEPYFACITSFMQVKPEIGCLVWGILQFLFKLCRNYTSFLEKLAELLEKVTQDLQLQASLVLQAMDWARKVGKTDLKNDPEAKKPLFDAMILLYSDLMDLLCTISDLFAERDGEGKIGKVFWVPFDEHFAHFQQKFRAHQTILDVEVQKLEGSLWTMAYENLKTLQETTFERLQCNQWELMRIRLDSLKTWIGAHPWTPAFEESKRKRSPGTSTWIFSHPGYKWWSDPSTGSEEGRDSFCTLESTRVLSIQAKPGYGKSVLCGSIIQDLQQKAKEKNRGNDGTTSAVAYYFFDKQRSIQDDNTVAIRSIIAQLIHQYQDRPDLVDLALILRDFSTTGETTASIQDLRDLFALTLQAIGDSALVFDGLDECADVDNFLEELEGITRLSKTRILFSSRPSVNYKGFFQSCTRTVLLEGDTNLQDIETYLHSAIGRLIRSEALMLEDSAQNTVHSIAQKSRSMFLWASLMINYLSSEMMTQQDKIDAIREMSLFPELDSLYTRILKKLYSWHSHASARRNLQLLFEWICVAARPLRVSELQCALAIQIGRKTTKGREIANFEQHLVRNTGALVEVAGDNTVKFIHTSVLEFFMGAMEDSAVLPTRQPELKVDADGVQCAIASTCLSYLIFDGPKAPISTVIGPPVTPQMIVAKYPLILYATQFWSYHAFRSIEQWEIVSNKIDAGHDPPKRGLVQMMTAFLSNKPVVTTWTEIAWTAGHEPCLNGLPFLTWKLSLLRDSPLGEMMNRFCQDLSTLNLQWQHVLLDDPSEIWQPSIPAFLKSPFWVQTNDASVTCLDTAVSNQPTMGGEARTEPILVASQCCSHGSEVGMVKLWPSTTFHQEMKADPPQLSRLVSLIEELTRGWEVTYEIKSIQTQATMHSITVEMPCLQIRRVLAKAFASKDPKNFTFPVAFSRDLRQITILECLIRLSPSTGCQSMQHDISIQDLQIEGPFNPEMCPFEEHEVESVVMKCPCSYAWYHIMFSLSSRYLVVLRGPGRPADAFRFSRFEFVVYRDHGYTEPQPDFKVVSRILSTVYPGSGNFTFHPTQPILAISRMSVIVLWFFEEPDTNLVRISSPLSGLSFSRCGNYIHGHSTERDPNYSVVKITKFIDAVVPKPISSSSSHDQTQGSTLSIRSRIPEAQHQQSQQFLAKSSLPSTMSSNEIAFSKQDSRLQISMVRQLNESGEVLLQKISENGLLVTECITRLPMSSHLEGTHVTTLNLFNQTEDVQVILNKTLQETYSVDETKPDDIRLPLLVTRTQRSIPQDLRKRRSPLELLGGDMKKRH